VGVAFESAAPRLGYFLPESKDNVCQVFIFLIEDALPVPELCIGEVLVEHERVDHLKYYGMFSTL
jgi:hypothetical protein